MFLADSGLPTTSLGITATLPTAPRLLQLLGAGKNNQYKSVFHSLIFLGLGLATSFGLPNPVRAQNLEGSTFTYSEEFVPFNPEQVEKIKKTPPGRCVIFFPETTPSSVELRPPTETIDLPQRINTDSVLPYESIPEGPTPQAVNCPE